MFKNEKGSITIYVFIVLLFFTIILMSILASANNNIKNQKTAEATIIDKYQKEVDMIDIIYNEKSEEYKKLNHADIAEIKWNTDDIDEENLTASATINFYEDDLSKISNFKYVIDIEQNYIGENSNIWNSAQTISNNITAEGTLTNLSIEDEDINFIHVLINYASGKKVEIVSNGLRINE